MKYRRLPLFFAVWLVSVFGVACGEDTEPKPDAAITSFSADPAHVELGDSVVLSWETTNADDVSIFDSTGIEVPLGENDAAKGAVRVHPTADTTYELHAVGPSGKHAMASAAVTVAQPAAAPTIVSFTGTPRETGAGGTVTLAWAVQDATEIAITAGGRAIDVEGASPTDGSVQTTVEVATTFTLTATGPGGTARATTTIEVSGAPAVTFSAPVAPIVPGGTANLSWSATNAERVVITDAAGATLLDETERASGTVSRTLEATEIFTLSATGVGGTTTRTLKVQVQPQIQRFTIDTAGPVRSGDDVTVSWTGRGATSGMLDNGSGTTMTLEPGELAQGTRTIAVGPTGVVTLTLASGSIHATSSKAIEITLAPRIHAFALTNDTMSGGPDFPALATLSWNIDGAEELQLVAEPGGLVNLVGLSMRRDEKVVPVTEGTTFELIAKSSGGTTTATATLTIVPEPKIDAFAVLPMRLGPGESAPLSWQTADATAVRVTRDGQDLGLDPTLTTGTHADALALNDGDSVTYQLHAENSLGFEVSSAPVEVTVGAPLVAFTVDRTVAAAGSTVDFAWTNLGGHTLELVGPGGATICATTNPAEIAQGTCTAVQLANRESLDTFRLRVTNGLPGAERTTEETIQIMVVGGPVIQQFAADKTELTAGETITFTAVVDPDRDGVAPTVVLVDDLGNSYPVDCTDFSNCTFTAVPTQGGITAFTLSASTPGTTSPPPSTLPITVYTYPAIESVAFNPAALDSVDGAAQSTLEWITVGAVSLEVFQVGESAETSVFTTTDTARLASGSQSFDVPVGYTTFRVQITNPLGVTASGTAVVAVDAAAVDTFTASRTQIVRGESTDLSWTTRHADKVRLKPFTADLAVRTIGTGGFVDISTSPTVREVTTSSSSGYITVQFPAGFSFPWYGVDNFAVRLFAYGYLSFDTTATATSTNVPFPIEGASTTQRDIHLAPFWDALSRSTTAKTWWDERTDATGRKAVVLQWSGMTFSATAKNPSDMNFQVVLWEDGSFEYHYGNMTSATADAQGLGATIGYQDWHDAQNVNNEGYTFQNDTARPTGMSNLSLYFDGRLQPNGGKTVKPRNTTTYELHAINGHSTAMRELTIEVFEPTVLVGAIASATEADIGAPVRISWSTQNASAVEVVDGSGAVRCTAAVDQVAAGNCTVTENAAGSFTYTVRVTGLLAHDVVEQPLTVVYAAPLTGTLVAASELLEPGTGTTLTWDVTGAASATLTANGDPLVPSVALPTGSIAVQPADTTTYVLTLTAADGRTATVERVVSVRTARIVSVTPDTQIAPGAPVTVGWVTTGGTVRVNPRVNPEEITGQVQYEDIHLTGTTIPLYNPTGTSVTWTGTVPFPDGFTFPFGGVEQTQATVGACGWLTFTSAVNNAANAKMPSSGHHMAVFWDLIYARAQRGGTGDVFYELKTTPTGERYLIIQWYNQVFATANVNDSLNFQVVLWENGNFEYRYGTMYSSTTAKEDDARGSGATIGYTSLDGTEGINLSHDTDQPLGLQGRAWRFTFRDEAVGSQIVNPTETTTYEICVDSSTGNYTECRNVTVTVVQPGDLLVSELMIEPASGEPEWFEIRNLAPYPIDLSGMTVRSMGDTDFVLSPGTPVVLDHGESVVIANGTMAGSVQANVQLDNNADSLELLLGSHVVDSISWSGWPVQSGSSFSLDGLAHKRGVPAVNDAAGAWCLLPVGNPGVHGPTCSSTWYDVDTVSGAPFIDIAGSPLATDLAAAAGTNAYEQVPGGIGFTIPYFGEPVSDLWVAKHGYTSFLPLTTATSTNANIPTTGVPNGTIAAFWDSMLTSTAVPFSIKTELRQVDSRTVRIVQWNGFWPMSTTVTSAAPTVFQTQIWSDGEIVTVVKETSTQLAYNRGSSATLGIENLAGNAAVKYSYNEQAVYPGLAIRYTPKAAQP